MESVRYSDSLTGLSGGPNVKFLLYEEDEEGWPLEELYYCDQCNALLCQYDMFDEIDSYYCAQCLETLPSSEAFTYGNRCSKCFDCPRCFQVLQITERTAPPADAKPDTPTNQSLTYFQFTCSYCRWESGSINLTARRPESVPRAALEREKRSWGKNEIYILTDSLKKGKHDSPPQRHRHGQRIGASRGSITGIGGPGIKFQSVGHPETFSFSHVDVPTKTWRFQHLENMQKLKEEALKHRSIWDVISTPQTAIDTGGLEGISRAEMSFAGGITGSTNNASPPKTNHKHGSVPSDNALAILRKRLSSRLGTLGTELELLGQYTRRRWVPLDDVLRGVHSIETASGKVMKLVHHNIEGYDARCVDSEPSLYSFVSSQQIGEQFAEQAVPFRKQLQTKRSHRCHNCHRLVVRAHINLSAAYKEKNNFAMAFLPSLRISRCGPALSINNQWLEPLKIGEDGWCDLQFCNLSAARMVVHFFDPLHAQTTINLTVLNENSPFEIPPFDEMSEMEDLSASPSERRDDDPPCVIHRRSHVVTARFELRPVENHTATSIARFRLGLRIVTIQHSIETAAVITLGHMVPATK